MFARVLQAVSSIVAAVIMMIANVSVFVLAITLIVLNAMDARARRKEEGDEMEGVKRRGSTRSSSFRKSKPAAAPGVSTREVENPLYDGTAASATASKAQALGQTPSVKKGKKASKKASKKAKGSTPAVASTGHDSEEEEAVGFGFDADQAVGDSD